MVREVIKHEKAEQKQILNLYLTFYIVLIYSNNNFKLRPHLQARKDTNRVWISAGIGLVWVELTKVYVLNNQRAAGRG